MNHYTNITIMACHNCGKDLLAGDKEYCEKNEICECAECRYLALIGARAINGYNSYLRLPRQPREATK